MRDLLILAVVFAALPVIPFRPFLGLLVYSWLAYMRPQDLAWGVADAYRLSFYVAVATLVGIVVWVGRERLLAVKAQTVLLVLLAAWIGVTTYQAVNPRIAEHTFDLYWKAILVGVVTTGLVQTKQRLRILLLVIAFSFGLLAAKYGVWGLLRGGVRFHDGPGGFMGDNNGFAAALAMALPLLVGVVLGERSRLLRLAGMAMVGLCVVTILFSFSRGGFLALGVVGALILIRSGRPLVAGLVLILGLGTFFYLADPSLKAAYAERIQSIEEYEEDGSSMARIKAWEIAWQVYKDHPVFGVGPDNFMVVYRAYGSPDQSRVAHNSFFQMLAECGLPGLVLFVTMLGLTLTRLEVLRRRERGRWIGMWAQMIQIAVVGYVVTSLTLNRAYFDLIYHLVGISASLEIVAARLRAEVKVEAAVTEEAATEVPWWKRPAAAAGEA